jgi:hypothetical protein
LVARRASSSFLESRSRIPTLNVGDPKNWFGSNNETCARVVFFVLSQLFSGFGCRRPGFGVAIGCFVALMWA